MARPHDVPLVGPGNELQLTIDGRAIPHADVVASSPIGAPIAAVFEALPADHAKVEQISLSDL